MSQQPLKDSPNNTPNQYSDRMSRRDKGFHWFKSGGRFQKSSTKIQK